jgi:hypothetical protein
MKVYNGRIYKLNGRTVRAIVKTQNGMRVVQTSDKLNGFVKDNSLEFASKDEVTAHIEQVRALR